MPIRVSAMYDKEVYSMDGRKIGIAVDFIYDDVEHRIAGIVVRRPNKEEVTIPYESVRACKDIFIIQFE
ncbi:MAG: hypothetical protein DRN81_01460 [Thermoproteota archaeon]|nr:MAG: hypothetical protein DRN81_01460 [Candidatus Korarchaeota archaeon]